MKVKTTVTYIAEDGRAFLSKEECEKYEESILTRYSVNIAVPAWLYLSVQAHNEEEAKEKALKIVKMASSEDFDIKNEVAKIEIKRW